MVHSHNVQKMLPEDESIKSENVYNIEPKPTAMSYHGDGLKEGCLKIPPPIHLSTLQGSLIIYFIRQVNVFTLTYILHT